METPTKKSKTPERSDYEFIVFFNQDVPVPTAKVWRQNMTKEQALRQMEKLAGGFADEDADLLRMFTKYNIAAITAAKKEKNETTLIGA